MIERPKNTNQQKLWLRFYIPLILYATIGGGIR